MPNNAIRPTLTQNFLKNINIRVLINAIKINMVKAPSSLVSHVSGMSIFIPLSWRLDLTLRKMTRIEVIIPMVMSGHFDTFFLRKKFLSESQPISVI